MCCDCWSEERGSDVLPYRAVDAPLRACCFCGKLTDAGIFVHREPKGLQCDAPAAPHRLNWLRRCLRSNRLLALATVTLCWSAGVLSQQKPRWCLLISYLLCIAGGYCGGILARRPEKAKPEIQQKQNSEVEFIRRIHLK